jgi:uncharacterized membrane protein
MPKRIIRKDTFATARFITAAVAGISAGIIFIGMGELNIAPLMGWDVAALVFVGWTWALLWPMDAETTSEFALAEDPARAVTDIALLGVSVASIAAVGLVLSQAGDAGSIERGLAAIIAIDSIVLSWVVVHTIFALKYAKLYYGTPEGGVDFGDERPSYSDFAYLAFTVGMTFQVSDTAFQNNTFRKTALRHSLFSYVFGTLIIAATINLIAGLGD